MQGREGAAVTKSDGIKSFRSGIRCHCVEFIALVRVPVTARSASRGTASKCPGPTEGKVSQLGDFLIIHVPNSHVLASIQGELHYGLNHGEDFVEDI